MRCLVNRLLCHTIYRAINCRNCAPVIPDTTKSRNRGEFLLTINGKKIQKDATSVSFSDLSIDKLWLLMEVSSPHDQQLIAEKCTKLSEVWGPKVHKSRYRHSFQFYPCPDIHAHVLVQHSPYAVSHRFFRCEFNPNRLPIQTVRKFLSAVFPFSWEQMISTGEASRIDVTFDIIGVSPDELLLYGVKKGVGKVFASYSSGHQIETEYIGCTNSEVRYAIYDKIAEAKKQRSLGKPVIIPGLPTTRVEARIKGVPLANIHKIPDPYLTLHIRSFPEGSMDDFQRLFLDSCRLRGFQSSRLKLNKQNRKKIDAWYQSSPSYKPAGLWENWENLCSDLITQPFCN